MIIFKRILILLFVALPHLLSGLDPKIQITQYVIKTWTMADGLPQNTINAILQTEDGFLWLGTGNGLARFDGIKFEIFNSSNVKEIREHDVRALYQDKKKNLWISFTNHLIKYEEGQFSEFRFNKGIGGIFENSNGDLCIFQGNEIWSLKKDKFYRLRQIKLAQTITDTFSDSKGNIWVGTQHGLYKIGENQPQLIEGTDNFNISKIFQIDNLSVGITTDQGLHTIGPNGASPLPVDPRYTQQVRSIFFDRDGVWWSKTDNGLIRSHQNHAHILRKNHGLSDNYIMCIYEDQQGTLWIGTRIGLSQIKNPLLLSFSHSEGLRGLFPRNILEDKRGNIWISCTIDGIYRFGQGIFKLISEENGPGPLYEDDSGRIWYGMTLSHAQGDQIFQYQHPSNIPIHKPRAICKDQNGNLWIGASNALYKISEDNLQTFKKSDGLLHTRVNDVKQVANGDIWIGTKGGLNIFHKGGIKAIHIDPIARDFEVMSIYEDKENKIWLGTYNGLYCYQQKTFTHYSLKQGLPDNSILAITEDDHRRFWFSSITGIFCIHKEDFTLFDQGIKDHITCIHFDQDDGMKNQECNGGYQPACFKARDGRLWFPTMDGVVVIDPGNIKFSMNPPGVFIQSVLQDGETTPVKNDRATIRANTKRIQFQFTAINFISPHKITFRYKLKGYDKNWVLVQPGQERLATYTNVRGGDYRFQVTAANRDGVWHDTGASLIIYITPKLNETLLFKIGVVVLVFLIIYIFSNFIRKYYYLFAFWKKKSYLGQYMLLRLIGYGASATVFLARGIIKKHELVAIKVLKQEYADDTRMLKRFKQEGAIIDQLDHDNIVKILERGRHEDNLYIVMEYLQGQTLAEKIKKEKKVSTHDFVDILRQSAEVLCVLHEKQIIHRDLKPSNIMLVPKDENRNHVKLLDFGLARAVYHTQITESGSLLGTIYYIPPEQITHSIFSPAGDIYALGMIAYEMITGILPFKGVQEFELLQIKISQELPDPLKDQDGILGKINNLIRRMVAKDPDQRPTASEILNEIKSIDI